ncbi:MAG: EAL domain-containing protein [Pseudomonadota bacterium]|nr:EAL domain-containing protein [Pseudomonadota bacterium]
MQLKGKTSAFILWVLMTLASVLISAWVHKLATHTPSDQEVRLVKRNFDVIVSELQGDLQWLARNYNMELRTLPDSVDVRLVFDQQDLLQYQTSLANEDQVDSLLTSLISFLKVPRQANSGITYWRDKVMWLVVEEQDAVRSVAAVFLDDWLLGLSDRLHYQLALSATPVSETGDSLGEATMMLPSLVGKPVYVSVSPLQTPSNMPYVWWLSVLISALVCGVLVWTLYYRPIWKRINGLLQQSRQIMKSGNFNQRLKSDGKDEISELAVQINAILSSLEYCYNLMAKTNLITTELLQKVDLQVTPEPATALTEESELKSSLDVVSRLSEAFETDALEVFVQPVYAADRSQVTGYEALARWMDPEMGMVSPAEFVSMCEKAGLLDLLTELMLRHSLAALKELRVKHGEGLVVSINLSSAQFFSPTLLGTLNKLAAEHGGLLGSMEFEVRESTITHDFDQALILINNLKGKGLRVCIDDFGLSRYSLMYLQRLPVNTIKLSAVFTERLAWESREVAFIDGIARFADALNVRVIVKNIETDGQLRALGSELDVEYQGVMLSPPAPLAVALQR